MNKLEIYLGKKLLISTSVVLLVIISLDVIFSFVSQLDYLKNKYLAYNAFIYVILHIPGSIYEFMPVSILTGCLAGMGVIAADNELIAIRSLGISSLQIFKMLLKTTIFIVVLTLVVTDIIAPYTTKKAEIIKHSLKSNEPYKILSGCWHKEANEFIYFNSVDVKGQIQGVSRFIFNGLHLSKIIFADKAKINDNNHWLLTNVTKYDLNSETSYTKEKYETLVWVIALPDNLLQSALVQPDSLSIIELYKYNQYLKKQNLDRREYQLALWKKLLYPLMILVLIFAGMQAISGNLRSINLGIRVVIGIVCGSAFIILQKVMGSLGLVLDVHPAIFLFLPILVCFLISFIYSKKITA